MSMFNVKARRALTLVELLVVVAILALLAGLILAKMGGILERSQSAVQAANIHDSSRFIETYYALHKTYPDGWDLLVEGTAAGASTMYSKLSPQVAAMLQVTQLSSDQINSLRAIGINHANIHNAAHPFPSDSAGTDVGVGVHLIGHGGAAEHDQVVTLNKTNPAADQLLRADFNLPSYGATSYVATHTFVVFGFGPKNWAVSEVVQAAPMLESLDAGRYYARALAVFAVPNTGTEKAAFVGVFGPDGRSLRTSQADYNKQAPRDH
jgi:prepilin-type N-terminal cleavage/methylation domain-containing protein